MLLERRSGPEPAYRFALDPLAEFLAAYRVAERCGADAACWIDLARRLAAAPEGEGFLLALRITCEAYGPVRGWACVSLPGGAGAPASSVL